MRLLRNSCGKGTGKQSQASLTVYSAFLARGSRDNSRIEGFPEGNV